MKLARAIAISGVANTSSWKSKMMAYWVPMPHRKPAAMSSPVPGPSRRIASRPSSQPAQAMQMPWVISSMRGSSHSQ